MSALKTTIEQICLKTSAGMKGLLSKSLAVPISPDGIISKTGLLVTETPTMITIQSQLPDYAYWVEHGRRPGGKMPPEAPIKDWVKKHNIAEDAVFPIRRKIAKEGIAPKPFTEPLRRMIDLIRSACLSSFELTINETAKNELTSLKDIEIKL